ncbi:Phosphatase [Rhodovastum atsumiense]|uniref:metallophosphoesterase n=1 Tax=Rhodovastum atsumiense TaxID=504468 RepID=UPI00193B6133|nr:metallophosphoesterase [Rhodovastum atsumiense]CAH2599206.1 Phosphatase [Rhodovastum atsumiense]
MIPPRTPLRVVGDVHGDAVGFARAADTERFVIQLGDLTDNGPDSAGALRIALRLRAERRGLFLLGNHDHKLARRLLGREVRTDAALAATLAQLDPALQAEALEAIRQAPAWLRQGTRFFVHGGFHTTMLATPPPAFGTRPTGALARALFGQTTGRMQRDGYPERVLDWIDRIPPGLTVYCGHDMRSTDGRPWMRQGAAGGTAVFLDTGAGKGGHLSWIDLPGEG